MGDAAAGSGSNRARPGSGEPMPPYHRYQVPWRTVFGIDHAGARWDVDVHFLDWDERIGLYRDGKQTLVQTEPATFELPDSSRIEVRYSLYGMRRAHLVLPTGDERPLVPRPGTAERWRADLHRLRPRLSRAISITSVFVLIVVIGLQAPPALQWAGEVTGVIDFASPWQLPGWLSTAVSIAGAAALIERALRLRYVWWLDGLEGWD